MYSSIPPYSFIIIIIIIIIIILITTRRSAQYNHINRTIKLTPDKILTHRGTVGVKAWTFILGLKPHLLMGMHPRRSKWREKPQGKWSCKEKVEGSSPKGSGGDKDTEIS